jgi:mRNA interferase MazF
MKEGNIVLTPISQSNGQVKNRPVVILREMPKFRDCLVCGVSTQLKQYIGNFDEMIDRSDADFASSGLVSESLIRLGFLAVVPRVSIIGSIGSISPERHKKLLEKLSQYLLR